MMSLGFEPAPAVFTGTRLEAMSQDLGTAEPALNFLARYSSLLPARINRIAEAVRQQDTDATVTAALSLKTSSAMVGALELEARSAALTVLQQDELPEWAEGCVAELNDAAFRFTHEAGVRRYLART